MNFLFQLLLTFNATSLIGAVYLVKQGISINRIFCITIPSFVSYALYVLIPIALTGLSLLLANKLSKDSIAKGGITGIEPGNNSFMASYLGYFFVAVSIPDHTTFLFIYVLLFVFTFLSQTHYYNPMFLLYGYRFYFLTTNSEKRIFVITKERLDQVNNLDFEDLKRINDFTYIDKSKK